MEVRITNIQRFSLQDGPGIRTTVFLKGCNLRCPWCANPENISYQLQEYSDKEENSCGIYGKDISVDQLYEILMKDKSFYENNGGITFSGGEPLLQIRKYEPFLKKLKEEGVHISVETALFIDLKLLKPALLYFDLFIVDLKILYPQAARMILGADVKQYINNMKVLLGSGSEVILRMPMIAGYTDTGENMAEIRKFFLSIKEMPDRKASISAVELLIAHNFSNRKRASLNMEAGQFTSPPQNILENLKDYINQCGFSCRICRL